MTLNNQNWMICSGKNSCCTSKKHFYSVKSELFESPWKKIFSAALPWRPPTTYAPNHGTAVSAPGTSLRVQDTSIVRDVDSDASSARSNL